MRAGLMDVEDTKAAILKAEQAITLMDSRLQHKLRPEHKRALANAILRSGAQDDLVFHHQTVRKTPGWWTLGGLLARVRLLWEVKVRKQPVADQAEQLADWAARIRRSGARRLLIAALIGLICGLINFGLPAELALQALRDKTRPIKASGDIVVVAKDEISRKAFGELPWSRKYDALLLDRLREMGAKRIVFNEVFSGPTNKNDDAAFVRAIRSAKGKVWLSGYYEQTENGKDDFLPNRKFDIDCCIAHRIMVYNAFGYVNYIPSYLIVGNKIRPSSSMVLASSNNIAKNIIPDFAIDHKSIPFFSASSIINGNIRGDILKGKNVIISETSAISSDNIKISGQGLASNVFVRVIAAETLKNGPIQAIEWQFAFLFAVAVCVACIAMRRSRQRYIIVISGVMLLLVGTFIFDRFDIRVELVPALGVFALFGLRDRMMHRILEAQLSDPVSGLPSMSEMILSKTYKKDYAGALKIERFATQTKQLDILDQRNLARSVAARINIIFPESVIHQGEDGVFVWAINPNSEYDPIAYIAQLTAIFRIPIGINKRTYDVGVAIGFGSDMSSNFEARLAVAVDRARISLFGTLTSVQ